MAKSPTRHDWGFQSSPVCGLCVVVCGDFEIFQSSLCVWALCCGVWGLWVFQSSPVCETLSLYWRDWVFTKKIPVLKTFPCTQEIVFSGQNHRWWRSKAVVRGCLNVLKEDLESTFFPDKIDMWCQKSSPLTHGSFNWVWFVERWQTQSWN